MFNLRTGDSSLADTSQAVTRSQHSRTAVQLLLPPGSPLRLLRGRRAALRQLLSWERTVLTSPHRKAEGSLLSLFSLRTIWKLQFIRLMELIISEESLEYPLEGPLEAVEGESVLLYRKTEKPP